MLEFILTVGISASGKSSWVNQQKEYITLDSDKIRGELYNGDETDQQNPDKVFNLMYRRTVEALTRGQSVIYCATNLAMKYRIHTLTQIKRRCPDVYCRAVIFNTPLSICREWNQKRERHVPDWLFEKQVKQFQCPVENEGFDSIEIITPQKYDGNIFADKIWRDVRAAGSQDNPHHSLTLFDHLMACINNVNITNFSKEESVDMLAAAAIHDIGKAYTRSYDDKGIAHYYRHESYSAYLAMNMQMPLQVVQLVCHHMHPYNPQSRSIWEKRLGADLWKKILILHDADERSH